MNASASPTARARVGALILAIALLSLAPAMEAGAAGTQDISGYAPTAEYYYYSSVRYITSPSSFGADVAFKKYSGPSGLQLGTSNCNGSLITGMYAQATNEWRTVAADGSLRAGAAFCLVSYSSSSPGNFSGLLDWD